MLHTNPTIAYSDYINIAIEFGTGMGCASSTPMVATAGSEMLKAATHVAGDAKQKGEAAVEGVCLCVCRVCSRVSS